MYSLWSQRMSGITLKRSARVLRMVSLPLSVRPTGSGPRASQKVASSVKCETMRSTSRLLKAAESAFMSSGVAMSGFAAVTSGIRTLPQCVNRTIAGPRQDGKRTTPKTRLVRRRGGFDNGLSAAALLGDHVAARVDLNVDHRAAAQRLAAPAAVRIAGQALHVLVAIGLDLLERVARALGV